MDTILPFFPYIWLDFHGHFTFLNLTKVSQLQRRCKCLEHSVFLLKDTVWGIDHFSSLPPCGSAFGRSACCIQRLIDLSPCGSGRCLLGPQWDLLQFAVISRSSHSIVNRLYLLVPQSLTCKQNWISLIQPAFHALIRVF